MLKLKLHAKIIILSCLLTYFFSHVILHYRKKADVNMEGQFLVRQIYDDQITYNLVTAAVEILSKYPKQLILI